MSQDLRSGPKKVLLGKKTQDDPPYQSWWARGPGGQQDQGDGVILHDQREYQQTITLRCGSSKVPQGEVPRKAQTRKSQEGQDDQDVSVKGIDLNVGSDMNYGRVDGAIGSPM